jgi:hypothetical protein
MLAEQDDATLDPEGDVSITIVHEGEAVTLYRDDLDSIAFNSCLGLADGTEAAETVGSRKLSSFGGAGKLLSAPHPSNRHVEHANAESPDPKTPPRQRRRLQEHGLSTATLPTGNHG